jgi:hypothetical protein
MARGGSGDNFRNSGKRAGEARQNPRGTGAILHEPPEPSQRLQGSQGRSEALRALTEAFCTSAPYPALHLLCGICWPGEPSASAGFCKAAQRAKKECVPNCVPRNALL